MTKKHDTLCNKIASELEERGFDVDLGIEYGPGHKTVGELDVVAYKDGHLIIAEVKTNTSKANTKKAYEQLHRASTYFTPRFGLPVKHTDYLYLTNQSNLLETFDRVMKYE